MNKKIIFLILGSFILINFLSGKIANADSDCQPENRRLESQVRGLESEIRALESKV